MNQIESLAFDSNHIHEENKNDYSSNNVCVGVSIRNRRKGSQVSISNVSSNQSDVGNSEETSKLERKASLQELIKKGEEKLLQSQCKRGRSMSDGDIKMKENEDSVEVFSRLSNSVLEKLGLRGDGLREHLSEEELEQKFTSLALAFTIDATTIKDRCERQRRSRDQTEANLSKEMVKFKEKLALMQPLCIDYEKAELLSSLMSQIDIIMKATSLVSISAEKFGSVQQEERLTDSVGLIVSHVQMLKQQRDSARNQLQYTKRVLQNSSESPPGILISQKPILANPNRKIICRRRASIASISQPLLDTSQLPPDIKKVLKRTSELPVRSPTLGRNPRPNRLELGGDLVEIKEGSLEPMNEFERTPEIELENDMKSPPTSDLPDHEEFQQTIDLTKLSFRERLQLKFHNARNKLKEKYTKWTDDGTIHEIYSFCALICFSLSVIIMANILIEFEYAKRGLGASHFFWIWPTNGNQKFSRTRH
ncbi:unnamed protein product [Phaedon cochleariae]|uniref:Lymphoid-restricted membrane protein-like n=1 Tax=Phaedon cochleariae TaxID=80249 RepID=A0A9N9SHB2_PHACE|nr:unnamed protein product [Phaedon cochleariae]